ncbi:hypothetical protein DEO72_LG4g1549 [Vigna unguiculata]|uniref:Uncharacterized protein n=1 Tax=Vigna unguiculata TaxID=3917 RepID=A0A4D6LNU8_VIGUN|nr:hypothetical protein DEO72_LG4g1549 [Vigna unguiculata]
MDSVYPQPDPSKKICLLPARLLVGYPFKKYPWIFSKIREYPWIPDTRKYF